MLEPTMGSLSRAVLTTASALACAVWMCLLAACGGKRAGESTTGVDAGADALSLDGGAIGTKTAPDCPGCTFPEAGASPCSSAPSIKIEYPPDGALLPPNLGTLSVQWVPHGAPFARFEVDFTQSTVAPPTDWRIITACSAQTMDSRGRPSAGCELTVDPASWSALARANRGGDPIAITVRGSTDGTCASTSENSIQVSLAEQDVLGTYAYWKSATNEHGTGGQLWGKTFGDATTPERQMTGLGLQTLCVGCHSISRDGSRMLAYPVDDTDADYEGLGGALFDVSAWPTGAAAVVGADSGAGTAPPGWTAFSSGAAWYLTSNGLPCTTAAGVCAESEGASYSVAVAPNDLSLWNGATGTETSAVPMAAPGLRPTMPDWSVDGTSVVFVQPTADGTWDGTNRHDDDHVFGGSIFAAASVGGGAFGAPSALVTSGGENNFYPTYSPDGPASFVLFDRAPLDTSVSPVTACRGVVPKATCPNDSFANPAARVMLVANVAGASPTDLQAANGSSAALAAPFSNSYPRFLPFVQTYKGKRLFWVTFSSTRDYGLRVINQSDGAYPCYPPDSLEWPGSNHHNVIDPACQQPQIWLAPVLVDPGAPPSSDPSGVAIWLPYQDATTHNHMATWSWAPSGSSCACANEGGACGPAAGGCGCCAGGGLVCSGQGTCIRPRM